MKTVSGFVLKSAPIWVRTVKGAEAELTMPTDKVRVFILATNEELMIARDTKEIVEKRKKTRK